MGLIVSNDDVENFMSSPVVKATYDDNNDGTVDLASLGIIIDTSEALFFGTIRGIYALPLVGPIDPLAKHIVLQLVHCQSIKRFPEIFRNDTKVCEDAEKLLDQLRSGELKLAHPFLQGPDATNGPSVDSELPRGYGLLEHSRRFRHRYGAD